MTYTLLKVPYTSKFSKVQEVPYRRKSENVYFVLYVVPSVNTFVYSLFYVPGFIFLPLAI